MHLGRNALQRVTRQVELLELPRLSKGPNALLRCVVAELTVVHDQAAV